MSIFLIVIEIIIIIIIIILIRLCHLEKYININYSAILLLYFIVFDSFVRKNMSFSIYKWAVEEDSAWAGITRSSSFLYGPLWTTTWQNAGEIVSIQKWLVKIENVSNVKLFINFWILFVLLYLFISDNVV